jgi:hypothetical protein
MCYRTPVIFRSNHFEEVEYESETFHIEDYINETVVESFQKPIKRSDGGNCCHTGWKTYFKK